MTSLPNLIRMSGLRDGLVVAPVLTKVATVLTSTANHLLASAGSILIATLWQSVALAAITALCLRLMPRTTATLRFTLWTAALLLICSLPLAFSGNVATPHAPIFHADPRWSRALASLWITLSLYRAFDLARHALRLRSLSRQAQPAPATRELIALLRAHRQARLCTSTQLDRPGVIGFLYPRVLIPTWLFEQLTAPELEQIVFHELEHLRRRDDWLNLLQKLALVAFPLNPVVSWIDRRLCLERELACDEGVVRHTRAPRLYAACLTRLAEYGLDHRALSLAIGFLVRQSELASRVAGVLRTPRTLSPQRNLALTGMVAGLLLGGSVELARCPQLISFTASPSVVASSVPPRLGSETWMAAPGTRPVLYTDVLVPRLVHAAFKQVRRPLRKTKLPRAHPPRVAQNALHNRTVPAELLAGNSTQPAPATPNPTPILVHYTLVRVEGGWLLLQL